MKIAPGGIIKDVATGWEDGSNRNEGEGEGASLVLMCSISKQYLSGKSWSHGEELKHPCQYNWLDDMQVESSRPWTDAPHKISKHSLKLPQKQLDKLFRNKILWSSKTKIQLFGHHSAHHWGKKCHSEA